MNKIKKYTVETYDHCEYNGKMIITCNELRMDNDGLTLYADGVKIGLETSYVYNITLEEDL